jgi:hypothetical protein
MNNMNIVDYTPTNSTFNLPDLANQFYTGVHYGVVFGIILKNMLEVYKDALNIFPYEIKLNLLTNKYVLINILNEESVNLTEIQKDFSKPFTLFFINIRINHSNNHSNIVIYDKISQTLERFEPHGIFHDNITTENKINNNLIKVFKNLNINANFVHDFVCPLQHEYNFIPYKNEYTNAVDSSSTRKLTNVSGKIEDKSIKSKLLDIGYCSIFSIWYALKRMKYKNLTRLEFHNTIYNKLQNEDILVYINGYTNFIIQKLYENAKIYGINYEIEKNKDISGNIKTNNKYKNEETRVEHRDENLNHLEYIEKKLSKNDQFLKDYAEYLKNYVSDQSQNTSAFPYIGTLTLPPIKSPPPKHNIPNIPKMTSGCYADCFNGYTTACLFCRDKQRGNTNVNSNTLSNVHKTPPPPKQSYNIPLQNIHVESESESESEANDYSKTKFKSKKCDEWYLYELRKFATVMQVPGRSGLNFNDLCKLLKKHTK